MIDITISWDSMKSKADGGAVLRYAEAYSNYYIYTNIDDVQFTCVLDTGSADASDFENNYMNDSTLIG